MGVLITNTDYTNTYRPEQVGHLLGNVGDWQSVEYTVNFATERSFSLNSLLSIEGPNDLVALDGRSWKLFGFEVGDAITFEYRYREYDNTGTLISTTNVVINRNIVAINGDTLVLDGAALNNVDWTIYPSTGALYKVDNAVVWADKRPNAISVIYGHLTNDDSASLNITSFIDATLTTATKQDADTMAIGVPLSMDLSGTQSGMSIESAIITYLGKTGSRTYNYTIEVEFMISAFFEEIADLEDKTPPSWFFNTNCVTDNVIIQGFPEYNDPNTLIQNDLEFTRQDGNTGWFDENYNGLINNFELISLEYLDNATGQALNGLSHTGEVMVKAVISGVSNLADGLTENGIGFIWIPEDETLYKEKTTPFHKNLKVNTGGGALGTSFLNSPSPTLGTYQGFSNDLARMDIKDVHFYEDAGNLVYEAIFAPTPEFTDYMNSLSENNRNFAIWVSIGDHTLATSASDRVTLFLDYGLMESFVPPVGAWEPMTITLHNHVQDGSGANLFACDSIFVEDDILAKAEFTIDITDIIPNAVEFKIEAVNPVTGQVFELSNFAVDLSVFPNDPNGVPQWAYDDIRGYKLEDGNNKNWVKVERLPALDSGNNYGYVAYFAFKVRWEDWIERANVPEDFFDANELNNGFNNDWFHYYNNANWGVYFSLYLDAVKDGDNVRYVNRKELRVADYHSNDNIDEVWRFYRESDGLLLTGGVDLESGNNIAVIIDEPVRVEVTYTRLTGTWSDIEDVYGTICVEEYQGAGQFSFRQLSSFYGSEPDNPLRPLAGETKLKKTLVSPTEMRFECLIDPSFLSDAQSFKFSSRLETKNI